MAQFICILKSLCFETYKWYIKNVYYISEVRAARHFCTADVDKIHSNKYKIHILFNLLWDFYCCATEFCRVINNNKKCVVFQIYPDTYNDEALLVRRKPSVN